MNILFSITLFLISLVYLILGLKFQFMMNGLPAEGFLPRIVGVLLLVFSGVNLYASIKKGNEKTSWETLKDILIIFVASIAFIFLFNHLGAVISMILFMFVILYMFNRQKLTVNIIISIVTPMVIYFMFNVWLNVNFPEGVLAIF
ncbi:hypothetical protein GCM10009001_29320 [Virgibacillus siamensis]|uniref:DUF1468 domain-containing protein n=1 Tax=Virgibacillus siamensis TaxID=480071 RepID=A0ABP3RLS0_9BACI